MYIVVRLCVFKITLNGRLMEAFIFRLHEIGLHVLLFLSFDNNVKPSMT
jgi:hypothetical protein